VFLQKLEADADRIVNLPPPMYDMKPVKWVVDLNMDGTLLGVVSTADGGDSTRDRGKQHLVPFVKRTSGIRPILFSDTSAYTFGDETNDSRAASKHEAYMELVRKCSEETESNDVRAVLRFLEGRPDCKLLKDPGKSDLITFRTDGRFVVDAPEVREFWQRSGSGEMMSELAIGQCLVCGERRPIPAMTPVPVKGIPAGQSSGTALVGANIDVFESYGLRRGATCCVCHQCGERFGKALNELLACERTHLVVGPTVFVFWAKEKVAFDLLSYLSRPEVGDVASLLNSYRTGRAARIEGEDLTRFNVAALSASGGRAVLRDYADSTVGETKRHLARWFALTSQVDEWGDLCRPLGLYQLAAAPFRDPVRQIPPHLPAFLVRAALYGSRPLPLWLLSLTLGRCKAGGTVVRGRRVSVVTHAQAALLKAVLSSSTPGREDYMSTLDTSETSTAYLCGRLFAVLEAIQRRAIPGINATVVDKYFASASTAPASVFGKLLSDAQPHLAKLRKSSEGSYFAFEARLEELLAPIDSFPATLALRDQALFSLGFYHQRAADRAGRKAAKKVSNTDVPEMEE
jgi:CRISPR-associated protein Csd1